MKNRFSYIVFVLLLNVVFFIHNIILNDSFILYLNQAHIIYVLMFLNAGLSYELNFSFKSKPLQFFAAGLMVTSLLIFFKFPIFFWVWTIPLCILGFAYLRIALNKTGRFGDFTYGIYIFTFPVQQMIVSKYGATISPLQLFVCSVLFCLPLAILSWHLLEKKCLQLKERVV